MKGGIDSLRKIIHGDCFLLSVASLRIKLLKTTPTEECRIQKVAIFDLDRKKYI